MTGDRHDEPAAMDLSPILAALRSSWLVWILTVKPVCIFNDSCFVLFCFWTRNCIYYVSVRCVWFLIPCVSCHSTVSVKIFKPRTVHFVFSLRIFVFAHVLLAYNITALGMFTNLCLVLLSQFADSLVPKFHLQLTKKSQRRVREMVGHSTIRQMVWQLQLSSCSIFYTLIEHALSINYSSRYIRTLLQIYKSHHKASHDPTCKLLSQESIPVFDIFWRLILLSREV